MGYIRHNAIVVTTWKAEGARKAIEKARELCCQVAVQGAESINGYTTFVIVPDGSKEGWDASIEGDKRRNEFVKWISEQCYEDGSSWYEWAEIAYGNDDRAVQVIRSQWSER